MVNFRELATECRERAKEQRAKAGALPHGNMARIFRLGKAQAYEQVFHAIESNLLIFPLDPEDVEDTGLEPEEVLKDAEGGKE